MSRLEELIEKLCPDGVEYVAFGTVCKISKGIQFNKADMNEIGTYPVINGGINPSGYIEQYNQEEYTQREIAEQLGISRSYVSRIEKSAIEKLRDYF